MSKYFGEVLCNKAGVVQVDKFGKPLRIGQKVIFMKGGMSKGGRGDIGNGVIVAFNRYAKIITESRMNDDPFIRHVIETLNSPEYKKDTRSVWEKEKELNLGYHDHDDITPHFLIGVSDDFMRGWQDGSIRE